MVDIKSIEDIKLLAREIDWFLFFFVDFYGSILNREYLLRKVVI